jgi:non-ribosomal peptide synthase protein (TIGR01720 family)
METRHVLVEMEGHGREDLFDDLDLSRTVGWFTTSFPVLITLERSQASWDEVQNVAAQLRAVPRNGLGFGVLRYLSPVARIAERLSRVPVPQVNFNYLGRFDQTAAGNGMPMRMATESVGPEQDPDELRTSLLNVVAIVTGSEMDVRWLYSENCFRRSTIQALAKSFVKEIRRIVKDCTKGSTDAVSTGASRRDSRRVMHDRKGVED